MKHIAFPEIGQFRQAIRAVKSAAQKVGVDANGDAIYDSLKPLPKLKYRGTPKLHGTNSAIGYDLVTKEYSVQSRQKIITIDDDNAGFARFAQSLDLRKLFAPVIDVRYRGDDPSVVIFGEWCGNGIQSGVAINQLDKMFVVFAVLYRGHWLSKDLVQEVKMPENRVFNIYDFPSFEIEIDFQNPELFQNKLGEITLEVEKECPVGKFFGVSGVGEGVVWTPEIPFETEQILIDGRDETVAYTDVSFAGPEFWFKVKGEKHSASKVKTLASVDTEKVNSINELMEKVVTENRMVQGVQVVKHLKGLSELTRANTGDLIRWVFDDVIKEESDTINASGIDKKDIGSAVSKKVKEWFFKTGV